MIFSLVVKVSACYNSRSVKLFSDNGLIGLLFLAILIHEDCDKGNNSKPNEYCDGY